jgi:hypothetical protein
MMTQETTARERRAAHPGCTYEINQALHHSGQLNDLILSGTLSPDSMVTAHCARGLLYAILALREAITDTAAGTAGAVTDLDTTLSIIAGAVTGDGEPPAAVLTLGGAR